MLSLSSPSRQRLIVRGVVQGVGFRPFVYRLAHQHGLTGFVGNNSNGVFIEIEGDPAALAAFDYDLRHHAPPLAHIDTIAFQFVPLQHDTDFSIQPSHADADASTLVSPDICICDDCHAELFDPTNRRYRYPFINCTNCGPRFTITRDVPYDRPLTTMADFKLCPTCQAEYDNPADRRFHAQPNACPVCGPQVWLQIGNECIEQDAAIIAAQGILKAGQIVAVKGIGGFHLACDATNPAAIAILRARKGRMDKPFAVMASTLAMIHTFAHVNDAEATLLQSRERPIVLLEKRADGLPDGVAPGNPNIGVMLPYSPLHYLLLDDRPLIMTSGNFSGEPIYTDNAAALERLAPLVDAFLLHDRPIHVPCDDSVVRVFQGVELPVRRSRGYAPFPVKLPFPVPPVLAAGAELKNTFCLTRDDHAFMSQHIGDMENLETVEALTQAAAHMRGLFRVEPKAMIADRHPRYLSSQWAKQEAKRLGLPLLTVQHHHAHIAAVMAENGQAGTTPVIGVCLDGTGYGDDGAIWGGEFLVADYGGFQRVAHLSYVPLPGGDSAVKHPRRMALAYLQTAQIEWQHGLPPVRATPSAERRIIARQLETGLNVVPTSSMGRLFDAVAALAGVRQDITYEAQAAMELEALVDPTITTAYPFPLILNPHGPATLDVPTLIRAVAADVLAGVPVGTIAAQFHRAVAESVVKVAMLVRSPIGLNTVALSGGVFQNTRLLAMTIDGLREHNFEVLTHRIVPPNDGGLALGQAIIGARMLGNQ